MVDYGGGGGEVYGGVEVVGVFDEGVDEYVVVEVGGFGVGIV